MVISLGVYLTLLAAIAIERLFEVLLSARNTRRALAAGGVESGQRHYPLIIILHTLFIISAAGEAIILKRPFPGGLGWIAVTGALLAQALRYWSIRTLGGRWTTRIIVLPNATPMRAGPYRFVRHPNYLAVIVEIACVPLIHGCWLTAIVFSAANAGLLTLRIRTEEAALGRQYAIAFGNRPRFFPLKLRATALSQPRHS